MRELWDSKPLAEVCLMKPPKSEARKGVAPKVGVSFVPMADLGTDEKFVKATQVKPLASVVGSYTYFADGDVLLAKITPCFENGKLGIATSLTNGIGFGSSEFIVLRPRESIDKEYLYYYLSRRRFRDEGAARMGGAVGHQRVPKEFVESYPIPVPPLDEQRRIVAILDEALDGIATAKANAEKNLQNASEVFESRLNRVFKDSLTHWVSNALGELCIKIGSGATPRGGKKSYRTEGISLVRSLNVHDSGFQCSNLAYIDERQADKLSNVALKRGDVLLNITGASVARCCVVPLDVMPARVNQHVSIVRPSPDKVDSEFLHYLLISRPYKTRLLNIGNAAGSTRQAITKAQLQEFRICCPQSLPEQRSIAADLSSVAAKTQRLATLYQRKIALLDELKSSLLDRAFSGQL